MHQLTISHFRGLPCLPCHPPCQDFNTPMLNRNASVNRLKKENAMKIAQNKKNDQLIEIRKSGHQEYMLNSNMVITDCDKNKDDTAIHGNINNKKANERVKTKAWTKGTCLVTGGSLLGHIDETRTSRKFKVKVRLFPGAKTEDMFHYLVPLLEKMPDYVILHVGTNDAMDYEASAIVEKIIHVKEFIKLRVPNCKVIISRPTKRHDNENAPRVIEEVIAQFQKLTIDMKQNENIGKKQLGKRGFHLDGFSLKKFRQNLIARTGEL